MTTLPTDETRAARTLTIDDVLRMRDDPDPQMGLVALREEAPALADLLLTQARLSAHVQTVARTLVDLVLLNPEEARKMAADLRDPANAPAFEPTITMVGTGSVRLSIAGWPALAFGRAYLDMLDADPRAVNYVELELRAPGPDERRVLVTLQRLERPSPHDKRLAAEKEARALLAECEALRRELDAFRGRSGA